MNDTTWADNLYDDVTPFFCSKVLDEAYVAVCRNYLSVDICVALKLLEEIEMKKTNKIAHVNHSVL